MPNIVNKQIYWEAVQAADLDGYRVYAAPAGTPFSYDLPFVATAGLALNAPSSFPEGTFSLETDYNIWVTALDIGGNESDPLVLSGRFDFVAPPAPATGGIRDL